jgi:hypothetical protein
MPNAKDYTVETGFLNIMVSGSYGTGKSTFLATAPTPGYVFDFDNQIAVYRGCDFDYGQFQLSPAGWAKFEVEFRKIKMAQKDGQFRSIIYDSTTGMIALAMERALSLDPKRSPTGGPLWNVHYQMVKNLVEGKIRQLLALPNCNHLLACHLKITQDMETGAIISIDPSLTGQLVNDVPAMFGEVYIAKTRQKGGKTQYKLQTVTKGHFKARSNLSGKVHLLPDEMENDYPTIIRTLKEKDNE